MYHYKMCCEEIYHNDFTKYFLIFSDPPEVSVELGSKLNAVDIREGDDVYFECSIDAFPSADRISWKKDVSFLNKSFEFW